MTQRGQGNERVTPADGQPWEQQPWRPAGDGPNDPGSPPLPEYAEYGEYGGHSEYGAYGERDQGYGPRHGRQDGPGYGPGGEQPGYGGQYGGYDGGTRDGGAQPSYGAPGEGAQPGGQPYAQEPYGGGHGYGYPGGGAQPLPAESPAPGAADATQYLPPMPGGGHGQNPDAQATQYIPPFPQQNGHGAEPGQNPDAQATQFLSPVPPPQPDGPRTPPYSAPRAADGEDAPRQPPAEFDNLFRSDDGTPARGGRMNQTRGVSLNPPQGQGQFADPAQQPPQPAPGYGYPQPGYGYPPPAGPGPARPGGYGYPPPATAGGYGTPPPARPDDYRTDGSGPGRKKSPAILVAAVAGVAAVGLGVGALLSTGGGGGDGDKDQSTVAAQSPAASASSGTSAGSDAAAGQAKALDGLLADSNSSREAVIGAVGDIKSCKNLDGAADDLHGAASQRQGLVDRLGKITIDKLPDHAALAAALTEGWKASASADNHYAQWAAQAKSHKVCKHGSARRTGATGEGDRASGEATTAKTRAAKLWNSVATRYGLKQRTASDL
ncbi:hypothetical protein AB0910_24880 [Streptomyces sp. NPDC047002]|uniref:hypothetical protein n=1 Tax=Streptomyces sp. NPDC047002 TaxID=3155475 RepID=UPI003453986F